MNKEDITSRGAVVRLCDLSTGYRSRSDVRLVSRHLTTEIRSGELTCLLGANGCGKSTLLKTLSAFLPPVSGRVEINGRDIRDYDSGSLARLIGVVLTDRCSIRNMYVRELVGMGRSPYTGFWGRLSADDERIVGEALDFVNIRPLEHRMVHTLSDGERQKVMIAKALAQQTPVIFLDEPTAFLDYPSKVEIMQLLNRLSKQADRTVFLSTHDLELALQIADRLWLMKKGGSVVTGIPEDLALDGSLRDFFPGTGIYFDDHSGLYKIRHDYAFSVSLRGSTASAACLMARKALDRINVAADDSGVADSGIVVECTPGGSFVVTLPGGAATCCSTIDELLTAVRIFKAR